MQRKPDVRRHLPWRNPLADFSPGPYFGAPLFPIPCDGPDYRKATQILQRFYVSERVGEEDAGKLRNFVRSRDKHAFVIWGDIGIGKTTFLRYELAALAAASPKSFYFGVVDMLHASPSDAREQLERQLIEILENYFQYNFGSVTKGVWPYAEYRARKDCEDPSLLPASTKEIILESKKQSNSERASFLLDAIEYAPGPPLFVAIDNLDRAVSENQNLIADLVARRLHSSKIYLIFALRASSKILLDDAQILGFFDKSFMHLSASKMPAVLRRRFAVSAGGEDLSQTRLPIDSKEPEQPVTFPRILDLFLSSEAGEFVLDLAGTNARKALEFTSRVLRSNQLGGVLNIRNPEACIAALLMLDEAKFDSKLTPILNLFDNDEPSAPGNTLIRYRVFEFLTQSGEVSAEERRFTDYMNSLGYRQERVMDVVATFVGVGLAETEPVLTADMIRQDGLSAKTKISLVEGNREQYKKLLRSPWYFISCKNDGHIHEHLIQQGDGSEHVLDTDYVDFLKGEEELESEREREWIGDYGPIKQVITRSQLWAMARNAFNRRGSNPSPRSDP